MRTTANRPLCRAHPERAALLFLVPGRRGRGQGSRGALPRWVGASADADARAARPGLAGLSFLDLQTCWTEVTTTTRTLPIGRVRTSLLTCLPSVLASKRGKGKGTYTGTGLQASSLTLTLTLSPSHSSSCSLVSVLHRQGPSIYCGSVDVM